MLKLLKTIVYLIAMFTACLGTVIVVSYVMDYLLDADKPVWGENITGNIVTAIVLTAITAYQQYRKKQRDKK